MLNGLFLLSNQKKRIFYFLLQNKIYRCLTVSIRRCVCALKNHANDKNVEDAGE